MQQPANLAQARAVSDALLSRPPIPGLEVTELPPAEGALQWRLAMVLSCRMPVPDFVNTEPCAFGGLL